MKKLIKVNFKFKKPRTSTVCSAPDSEPGTLEIAVTLATIKNSSEMGLFSNFIIHCEKEFEKDIEHEFYLQAKLIKSFLSPPPDLNTSLVMIANGAGVGPMRGLFNRKFNAMKKGRTPKGELSLFLGTKTKGDLLFEEEYKEAKEFGVLNEIVLGFSREKVIFRLKKNLEKIYAQELVYRNKKIIVDYILKKRGSIIICGSTGLKLGAFDTLKKIFNELGLKDYADYLVQENRLLLEVWG